MLRLNGYGLILALVLDRDEVIARRICPAHLESFHAVERYVELIASAPVYLCRELKFSAVGLRRVAVKGKFRAVPVDREIDLSGCFSNFAADESDENGEGSEPYSVF